MLGGENFSRRHIGGLQTAEALSFRTSGRRSVDGDRRDGGLARPDIAFKQARHRLTFLKSSRMSVIAFFWAPVALKGNLLIKFSKSFSSLFIIGAGFFRYSTFLSAFPVE